MQDLILSKRLESVVFNPDLMSESNWAYLTSMEAVKDIHEDVNLFGTSNQLIGGMYGSAQLDRKQSTQNAKIAVRGATNEKSGTKEQVNQDAVDRLEGIIDAEDPRFDKLKAESIKTWQKRVNELCDSMNISVDRFYERKSHTYNSITNSNNFCREEFCPTANLLDITEEQVKTMQKPSVFNSLPGINLKPTNLAENADNLERLSAKLQEVEALGLWHEPVDQDERLSAFTNNIKQFLQDGAVETPGDESQITCLANAVSCLFGIAVFSGNFEIILQALQTMDAFERTASKQLSDQVFDKAGPQVKKYLAQIEEVCKASKSYHAMQGSNISAVFGIAKQFHNSRLTNENVSITTDGEHLYLFISYSQSASMFKVGTGMGTSVAGKIYQQIQNVEKEGDLTWVYCQGRLYARRNNVDFGSLIVYDPKNFKKLGEAKLVCDDVFRGNKILKKANSNYPLLTDGQALYALLMTVQKRERPIKSGKEQCHQALKKAQKDEFSSETIKDGKKTIFDASEALKAVAAFARDCDVPQSQLKEQVMKKIRHKGKKLPRGESKEDNAKKAAEISTPQREMQNYYVAVFSLHKFDISGGQKALEAQELEQMTEQQLFQIPIVREMKHAFADFFSIKDCAKALKMHDDDIEEAAAWLCAQGENPSVKWQIQRVDVTPICESLVSSKWSENSSSSAAQSLPAPGVQPASAYSSSYNNSSQQMQYGAGSKAANESKIQTSRQSVLHANCIEPGKWTMSTDGQLTYHTIDSRGTVGVAYVFSLNKSDYKPLTANAEEVLEMQKAHKGAYYTLLQDASMQFWYWNRTEWKSYSRQAVMENKHTEDEKSIRDKMSKDDLEEGKEFAVMSEWDLYDDVQVKSSLIKVIEDKRSLNLQTVNYLSYDDVNKKFFGITLEQPVHNIVIYDDLSKTLPHAVKDSPVTDTITCLKSFNECVLKTLLWANQYRFKMPWRWSNWSHHFSKVIEFQELGSQTIKDPTLPSPTEADKSKANANLKKLKKRQEQAREKEVEREMQRLGLSVLSEDQAVLYRNKVKKQMIADQKFEEKRKQKAEKEQQKSNNFDRAVLDYGQNFKYQAAASKKEPSAQNAFPASLYSKYGGFGMENKDAKNPIEVKYHSKIQKLLEQENAQVPKVNRELIKSMLFSDDKDSLGSDEDFNSMYDNEVAMMLEQGRNEEFWRFADRGGRGGRGGKKKKKASSRPSDFQPGLHPKGSGMPSYLKELAKKDYAGSLISSQPQVAVQPPQATGFGLFGTNSYNNTFKSSLFSNTQPDQASKQSLELFVLPQERISVPIETKKIFAYAIHGTCNTIRILMSMLKESSQQELILQFVLQAIAFSDHLMTYQDSELIDTLKEVLISRVESETDDQVKQTIWRILITGWYKFARDADSAIRLLKLFLLSSKPPRQEPNLESSDQIEVTNFYEALLSTKQTLTPIELFHLRFMRFPSSFYLLEALQYSSVQGYTIELQSKSLLEPKLTQPAPAVKSLTATVSLPQLAVQQDKVVVDDSDSTESEPDKKPADYLSQTQQSSEAANRDPQAFFRHKFRTHLLKKSKHLSYFDSKQQVEQKLSEVPIEAIYLVQHGSGPNAGAWGEKPSTWSITDQYFSMPLYQILNEEMVDYDKPELPRDDLNFLCQRYSSESVEIAEGASSQVHQETLYRHLMKLREENADQRDKLLQLFIDAIAQSLNDQSEVAPESYFWHDDVSFALIDTFKKLFESAMAIVDIKNPMQTASLHKIVRFIDEALSGLAKRTNNFRENPMKNHQIKWLEALRELILAVVWQLHLVLGSTIQNQVAYTILPTLLSILDTIKKLFNAQIGGENGSSAVQSLNILDFFASTNNEGVDPMNCTIFETSHPYPMSDQQRKVIQVPRALGYLIEIDPRSAIMSHNSQLTIRSTDYKQQLNPDFGTYYEFKRGLGSIRSHQFFVYGSSVAIEWTSQPSRHAHKQQEEEQTGSRWGVKLTIKPLMGTPSYFVRNQVNSEAFRQIYNRLNNDWLSWFQLMNLMVFLTAAFSRELTDGNLIQYQTDNAMTTGAGIYNLLDKKQGDSISEYSMSYATKSQIGGPSQVALATTGFSSSKIKKDMSLNNIIKSDILNWYLFKSGLKDPRVNSMSHDQALEQGLILINDSAIKKQEQIFESLKTLPEKTRSDQMTVNKTSQLSSFAPIVKQQTRLRSELVTKQQFTPRKEVWSSDITEFFDKTNLKTISFGEQVLKKIRLLRSEMQPIKTMFMLPSNKPYRSAWREVEVSLVGAMLYHSDSIAEAKKLLTIDDKVCLDYASKQQLGSEASDTQLNPEQSQLMEQFTLIGRQVNIVLEHMRNRLDGQKSFIELIKETIDMAQTQIELAIAERKVRLEKQKLDKEEKQREYDERVQMVKEEALMREFLATERKQKEELEKASETQSSTAASSDKKDLQKDNKKPAAPKLKTANTMRSRGRANVQRIAPAKPLPKPQKKKPKQAAAAQVSAEDQSKSALPQSEKKTEKTKIESKASEEEKMEEEDTVVLAELSHEELAAIKNKVSSETLQNMSQSLLGSNKLISLSAFFNIEYSIEDPHDTLKSVFKQVKEHIRSLIDLDDEALPVPEKLDISTIELGTPTEEVARDVLKRVMFLFEIIPSTNYQSEVTKIVTKPAKQAHYKNKRMVDIIEEIEEDQMSQHMLARGNTEQSAASRPEESEGEMLSDSDSEELLPEGPKRAYSVPIETSKPSFMNMSGGKRAEMAGQDANDKLGIKRRQSMEYADWIEGYRKWRLWNKKGHLEEDLCTAFGSPLQAVVSFAKCNEVRNLAKLRNVMLDHKYVGHLRLFGLQQQVRLFAMFAQTNFGRFFIGGQSSMLRESILNQVETCGEAITKQLNSCSRNLVQHMMNLVVSIVRDDIRISTNSLQRRSELSKSQKTLEQSKSNGSDSKSTIAAQESSTRQAKRQQSKQAQTDEILFIEDQRKMIHTLNDIKVLLSNVFTKEYILESLRQDKQIQTKDTLGIDQIRAFLKALVHIIVSNASTEQLARQFEGARQMNSILMLKQSLAQMAKIVLNQFTSDCKDNSSRQSETQRILQEMLLDIIVELLELRSYNSNTNSEKEEQISRMAESSELLKMLADMVQASSAQDKKPDISADQADIDQNSQTNAGGFTHSLTVGSKLVTRCASLLAYIVLSNEVPAVVRLAAKCAKVFFKLVDLQKINLYKHFATDNSQKVVLHSSLSDDQEGRVVNFENIDFLEECFKVIGSKITGTVIEPTKPIETKEKAKVPQQQETSAFDDSNIEKDESDASLNDTKAPTEPQPTSEEIQYFVYANLNTPREEDFTFLVTALWHWYDKYPNAQLQLIKDPSEICQEPPITQVLQKSKSVFGPADLKDVKLLSDASQQIKQLLLASQPAVEEEIKGAPDAQPAAEEEEEKKLEEPASAILASVSEMAAIEESLKNEVEKKLKEVEQVELQINELKQKESSDQFMQNITQKAIQKQIDSLFDDEFDNNGFLTKLIQHQSKKSKSSQWVKQGSMLAQAYQVSRQKRSQDFKPTASQNQLKIDGLKQILDGIVKVTFVNPIMTDSDVLKERRMNEKNYNIKLRKVIEDAVSIAIVLYQNNVSKVAGPFTMDQALDLSNILEQAYAGKLENVQLNPYMDKDKVNNKVSPASKLTVSDIFPISPAKVKKYMTQEKSRVPVKSILVAPKQLVISIVEVDTKAELENIFEGKAKEVKESSRSGVANKVITVPENPTVVMSQTRQCGMTSSVVIQELIQLVQCILEDKDQHKKHRLEQFESARQNSCQKFRLHLVSSLNKSISELEKRQWSSDFSDTEKQRILGLLAIIGGQQPSIRFGQTVKVSANNQIINAIVVEDGRGKQKLSVIYEDDDSLQISQVSHSSVKAYSKHQIDLVGDYTSKIDLQGLFKTVTFIYGQLQSENSAVNVSKSRNNCEKMFRENMLSTDFLLVQLLRLTSQICLAKVDLQDDAVKTFIAILQEIQENERMVECSVDGKNLAYWESEIQKAWESLIDKAQPSSQNFFSPRDYPTTSTNIISQSQSQQQIDLLNDIVRRTSTSNSHSIVNDCEYVQQKNTYLVGLPELENKSNQHSSKLNLLQYWERHIFPRTVEHLIKYTEYKLPIQQEMVIGQIRGHLLRDDISSAIRDLGDLFQQDFVALPLPDPSHDWSAKTTDECLVDSWALAKIHSSKRKGPKQDKKNASKAQESTSSKDSSAGVPIDLGHPILNKMSGLGIQEILVQIKAVDGKTNQVLTEYYDVDSMTMYLIWFPVQSLKNLQVPLGPRPSSFQPSTLSKQFNQTIKGATVVFARQTILQFFQALQGNTESSLNNGASSIYKTMQSEAFMLHDIISWGCLESFSESPITGWMKEFTQVIPINKPDCGKDGTEERKQGPVKDKDTQRVIQHILDGQIEKITLKSLNDQTAQVVNKLTDQDGSFDPLAQIKKVFSSLAHSLEDSKASELESEESKSVFNKVIDWCITNWYVLSTSVQEEKATLDICKEVQFISGLGNSAASSDQQVPTQVLPLHELMPKKGQESISTLIVFKKNGTVITPMSKIQFYSDKDQTNLVKELQAGKDHEIELPPIVINEAKVWVKLVEGSQELLPIEEQQNVKPKLECTVYQIPKEWTVVCWLTEVITSCLISQPVNKSAQFCLDTISKLVCAIIIFYEEAKAPAVLKSALLQILSRLVIKLRYIYSCLESQGALTDSIKKQSHLERLYMTAEFVQRLLSEVVINIEHEKHSLKNMQLSQALKNKDQVLYNAFIQDTVEFLMVLMVPTERSLSIKSYQDLLPTKEDGVTPSFSLPDWLEPLIKVSHFLHFFREEIRLPENMIKDIHRNLVDSHLEGAMDHIVVVKKIPKTGNSLYNKKWIIQNLFELLKRHQAIVLDGERDIQIIDDEEDPDNFYSVVIILDGFSHLRENDHEPDDDDDRSKMLKLLHSETDDEAEDNQAGQGPQIEEEKPQEPDEPCIWNCPICTFENPFSIALCEVCQTGNRPSKEELDRKKAEEKMVEKAEKQAEKEAEGVVTEPLHRLRLKLLARDIRHVISNDQRIRILEQLEQEKAAKIKQTEELEKAEKKLLAAQEEKKKKEPGEEKDKEQIVIVQGADALEDHKSAEVREEEVKEKLAFDDNDWIDEDEDDDSQSFKSDLTVGDQRKNNRQRSFSGSEKSGDDHSHSGSSDSDSDDESVDLENLPDDMVQRFQLLGIDLSMIDQDEGMIQAIEASAIDEMVKKQEQRREAKAVLAKEKLKAKQDALAALQKETDNLISASNCNLIKLEVITTEADLFGENSSSNNLVMDVLRKIVMSESPTGDFELTERTKTIIEQIHAHFQTIPLDQLSLPLNEPFLDDFEITKETIKEEDLESFKQKMLSIMLADSRLFFKLIISQGYDLHLTKAVLPTYDLNHCGQIKTLCRNVHLLRQVLTLIEKHYCQELQIVSSLSPSKIRILSMTPELKDLLAEKKDTNQDDAEIDLQSLAKQTWVRFANEESTMQLFPEISSLLSQPTLRYCWALLQAFNKHFATSVPFVTQPEYSAEVPKGTAIPMSIAAYMSCVKSLGLSSIKTDLKFLILDQTSLRVDNRPKLYFERLRMAEAMDKKGKDQGDAQESDDEKDQKKGQRVHNFMFLQAYEQIKDLNLAHCRPKKPVSSEPHLAFKVLFRGEEVQGDGGPYRQFFEDVSMELQPSKLEQSVSNSLLDLLLPCSNQTYNESEGKDKFVLNSEKTSSSHLNQFYFLGVLMGACIRTGAKMILDLPKIVWKHLVGQKINIDDIREVEVKFLQMLKTCLSMTKDEYQKQPLQWVSEMPDGKSVDLRGGMPESSGTSPDVSYEDRFLFIERALRARVLQSQAQCKAIRRGISEIVPQAFLNIGTHEELETWVCGRREVDIELLKRHTIFSGKDPDYCSESDLIKTFWQFLSEITADERQRFIKFCWGQQRLPANDEAFVQENVRFMIKPLGKEKNQDHMLPTSDTCFLNFGLPRYSSLEVMKQKILLAINMDCVSMNAEEVIQENQHHRGGDHSDFDHY